MAVYSNPDDVRSDMVRSMLQWWLGKCDIRIPGRDIPDRDDLDPAELKPLLPNILISDVEHEPFRIRYRLVGTRARGDRLQHRRPLSRRAVAERSRRTVDG